ncbi:MAG: DUF308 domain-containing protein [Erysipelotrichales bacterium]|nr:DUF308 domain-containing protein [Erysipelotrichales bacterium]
MVLEYAKRCEKNMLVSTVVTLVLGIVLAFEPSGSIKVITGLIATLFLLIGILQLIDYLKQSKLEKMMSLSLILGLVLSGIGVFLFLNIESLVNFITTIIGVSILVKSLFKLQFAFNLKGISEKWFYNLIVGILGSILGIVLLINPFESATIFLRIVGILLALGSILELIETLMVLKTIDDAKELPFEDKIKEEVK